MGCSLHWVCVARYFANTNQYSVITRTLAVAIPMNCKIMLGVAPIFVGFCLFAMAAFWTLTENFNNFSNTSYTLFAMMNGDSILGTFMGTTKSRMIAGQLFCYTFTFLAICVVQNMNLVIVEDSYLNVKYRSNFDWLTGEDGDEDHEQGPAGDRMVQQHTGQGGQGGFISKPQEQDQVPIGGFPMLQYMNRQSIAREQRPQDLSESAKNFRTDE